MMRLVKVELMHKGLPQGFYIDEINNVTILDLMDGMQPGGDSYRLSVVDMPEETFKALPEFTGF